MCVVSGRMLTVLSSTHLPKSDKLPCQEKDLLRTISCGFKSITSNFVHFFHTPATHFWKIYQVCAHYLRGQQLIFCMWNISNNVFNPVLVYIYSIYMGMMSRRALTFSSSTHLSKCDKLPFQEMNLLGTISRSSKNLTSIFVHFSCTPTTCFFLNMLSVHALLTSLNLLITALLTSLVLLCYPSLSHMGADVRWCH